MSGFVGIVHREGVVIDRALLKRLTGSMSFRGPDAQRSWVDRNVGLGHALLRASDDEPDAAQPFSLDGSVWTSADARVDDRARLIADLRAADYAPSGRVSDAELILRTYLAWGDECATRLLGDFAFAIWDGRTRRLLCARDQLGGKPFFY